MRAARRGFGSSATSDDVIGSGATSDDVIGSGATSDDVIGVNAGLLLCAVAHTRTHLHGHRVPLVVLGRPLDLHASFVIHSRRHEVSERGGGGGVGVTFSGSIGSFRARVQNKYPTTTATTTTTTTAQQQQQQQQ